MTTSATLTKQTRDVSESADAVLPFEGVRVIEVASFVAAPSAATLLADLGADIVKLETPDFGDPWRQQYVRPGLPLADINYLWNLTGRNKRSVALDLKGAAGQAVMHRLVGKADVFITNMPLSARKRLGITFDAIGDAHPRLVYASLTGYGETGGEIHEKGFDSTVWWGRSGLMEQLRAQPDGAPVRPPLAVGDHATGLAFFGAIAAALYRRERTGRGGYVGTSLLATGAWVNSCLVQAGLAGAKFSPRPARTETLNPMQCHYLCADKRWIMLIVNFDGDESVWERLLRCVGHLELRDDPRFSSYSARTRHCGQLVEVFDRIFLQRDSVHWVSAVRDAGFASEVISSPEDAARDQQMRSAHVISPLTGVSGLKETVASPVWFRDVPLVRASRAPELGEHADEVLLEHGFEPQEIAELIRSGTIARSRHPVGQLIETLDLTLPSHD